MARAALAATRTGAGAACAATGGATVTGGGGATGEPDGPGGGDGAGVGDGAGGGGGMEAASLGIPALAVSLETDSKYHLSYSDEVDSVAAKFTAHFARLLLESKFPADVDLFKVDIPGDATLDTPWQLTRVSRQRYYEPVAPQRGSWNESATIGYREAGRLDDEPEDTDVYVLRKKRWVAVSPLSLDLTSRTDFRELNGMMRKS